MSRGVLSIHGAGLAYDYHNNNTNCNDYSYVDDDDGDDNDDNDLQSPMTRKCPQHTWGWGTACMVILKDVKYTLSSDFNLSKIHNKLFTCWLIRKA